MGLTDTFVSLSKPILNQDTADQQPDDVSLKNTAQNFNCVNSYMQYHYVFVTIMKVDMFGFYTIIIIASMDAVVNSQTNSK